MSNHTVLRINRSTSRGRETEGWNIVTLTDETTHRRYKTMGGGYDMDGTVLANWAVANHGERLLTLAGRAFYYSDPDGFRRTEIPDSLYGVTLSRTADGTPIGVTINGGCGVPAVETALAAAGIRVQETRTKRGRTTGWVVTLDESAAAATA